MNVWSVFYITVALMFIVLAILNSAFKSAGAVKCRFLTGRITLIFTLTVLLAVLFFNIFSTSQTEYVLRQKNFIVSLSVIVVYTSILFNIIEAVIEKTQYNSFRKKCFQTMFSSRCPSCGKLPHKEKIAG